MVHEAVSRDLDRLALPQLDQDLLEQGKVDCARVVKVELVGECLPRQKDQSKEWRVGASSVRDAHQSDLLLVVCPVERVLREDEDVWDVIQERKKRLCDRSLHIMVEVE